MIKIRKIITSELFFVILVIIVGMGASLYPMIYELIHKNNIFPDRQFVLVYNFAPDYNAYLSKIIQGIQGKWLVSEYFTSELHQPSLLQIFYLMAGKIGGLISQIAEFSYHAIRIISGLGWIIAGWFFIKFSFTSKLYRKIALLFFVFGGNFPKLVKEGAEYGFSFLGQRWEPWIVGWSNLDPIKRITFIPHWNAGHVLTVLSILSLVKFLSHLGNLSHLSNLRYFGLSILFGIFAGFVLPPTLIIVYAILGLWICWAGVVSLITGPASARVARSYFDKQKTRTTLALSPVANELKQLLICTFAYFIFTFPTLIYNLWVTRFYPWKALVETDLYVNKIVFPYWDYMMGLGPLGFLGILGAFLALLSRKEKFYPSAFWVLGMFSLIIFFDKIMNWHNQTRFLEVGPELPLAVLSVVSLNVVFRAFGPTSSHYTFGFAGLRGVKRFREIGIGISALVLMILAAFLGAISIRAQTDFIDHKMFGAYPELSLGNYVVYPYKTIMEGVDFIKNNTTFNDVTLSGPVVGNHIGAYAGRFVYIGHGSQTVRYYPEKLPTIQKFYAGLIGMEEIKVFLKKNRIKFVFYGPEEKGFGDYPTRAEFLKEEFKNKDVVIYRVKL